MSVTTSAYASDALPGETVDVVVIGDGAAGLNGALMLARSRRSVVVIDSGTPRNPPAAALHGFIVPDGMPPTMHALSPHRPQAQVRPVRGPAPGTPRARSPKLSAPLDPADTDAALAAVQGETTTH